MCSCENIIIYSILALPAVVVVVQKSLLPIYASIDLTWLDQIIFWYGVDHNQIIR